MEPKNEVVYYQDDAITITNARAVFGQKTYAMVNITSVMMGTIPANNGGGIALALFGLAVAVCGGSVGFGGAIVGIIIIVGGILMIVNSKESYTVKIGSAGGETDALVSKDESHIQEIVEALNDAIIKRG